MSPISPDPVQESLSRRWNMGYTSVDFLTRCISICVGLYFLDNEAVQKLQDGQVRQDDFEEMVYNALNETDPEAAASFCGFSQTRLREEDFQKLFSYWVGFGEDKRKLRVFLERLINPHFARAYRPDLAVSSWLERLAIKLLPESGGTFYNGTSGMGGVALKIARIWKEKKLPLQVLTSEGDQHLYRLSVLRAKIHGFSFEQTDKDCLRTEEPSSKVDLSIMFPPLQAGSSIYISDSLVCGKDWSFAYRQLEALNETGVGICRVPNGALFNARNRAFREYLLNQNVLDAVIALPKNSAPFWPSAPATSLVVLRKGRKRGEAIRMMELPVSELLGRKNDFKTGRAICVSPAVQERNIPACEFAMNDYNLSPQRYLPTEWRNDGGQWRVHNSVKESGDAQIRETVELGEVAKIYRGINVAGLSRSETGIGVLRLSDVRDGEIRKEGVTRYDVTDGEKQMRYRICEGDILVSCKGKAIKLCLVSEDASLLLSHDFLGIRVDRAKVDPWYLYYFLQSPTGWQAFQRIQMGSSIPMIRAADLERFPLHYIPLAKQTQCAAELREANALVEEQLEALEAERQRAYKRFYQQTEMEDDL